MFATRDSATLVVTALDEMFNQHDPAAVDRWLAPDYRQHSPGAPDGPGPLRRLVEGLSPNVRHEPLRVLVDGDLVAVHGVYHGWATEPLVAFDIFGVGGGRLREHWDGLQSLVASPVGGRGQTDGPAGPDRTADPTASRTVVEGFAREVLVGADYGRLEHYLHPDYHQHNPEVADGIAGFGAAAERWAAAGRHLSYRAVLQVIADGDLVLVRSEGDFGRPVTFFDLFRVADGRIAEHWDVIDERTGSPSTPAAFSTERIPMASPAFADRTYFIRFDNGIVFRNTYSPDGTSLHYDTIEGFGTGNSEDVALQTVALGGGSYLVNWVEANGTTVTHLMDLDAGTVHAFWTFEGPDGRTGELHTASVARA